MSSYADPSNLVSLNLAGPSTHWDSRLKHMFATSLVAHAVLLFGLMSLRLVPTIQQPVASYSVDLVTVSELQVASPKQESRSMKKAPVQPRVKPEPKPQAKNPLLPPEPEQAVPSELAPVVVLPSLVPTPLPMEQVTQSIVSAVDSVVLPQSREITPIEKSSTLPPKTKLLATSKVEDSSRRLPVVPRVPELSTFSKKVSPTPMKSTSTGLLAETFEQTMKSVTVPHKMSEQQVPISTVVKPKVKTIIPSRKARSTTFPPIITPGQAPQPFEGVPVGKLKKAESVPRIQGRVVDSVKQVVDSVIVPKVKKSTVPKTQYTPAVVVPVPSRREFKPTLSRRLPEVVSEPKQMDLSQQTIAKLVLPEVKELQMHHVLSSPTEGEMQKTATALQVPGISSEGSVYWSRVWSKIDREWVAPSVDVRSDQLIHVLLVFRVERNGAVKNLFIEKSSGNKYYDLAAKRAVLDAAPLPVFPSDMPKLYYDVQFQFTVNLDSLS